MHAAPRKVGIGVDFGTTNSSVALFDGKNTVPVEFPLEDSDIVPSAIYFQRGKLARPILGSDAVDTYIRENENRVVQLSQQDLGELQMFVADQTFTFQIHALTDKELPGRLFRSLKRWLGDKTIESIPIFERRCPTIGLISPILSHMALAFGLTDDDRVYMGRPVRFGGDDEIAQERLEKAANEADYHNVVFYPEPVAAAVSYLWKAPLPWRRGGKGLPPSSQDSPEKPHGTYLCFDFGGGTLDLCVLDAAGGDFNVRSTHGIPLGGDLIDQLIYKKKLFPELGDGCPLTMDCMDGNKKTYKFHLYQYEEGLLNWQLAYRLQQPELMAPVAKNIKLEGETGLKFWRLHTIIQRNYSYRVLRAIEEAKIRLSDSAQTTIDVPELKLSVPITRAEFERYLKDYLEEIEQCVEVSLDRAEVSPSDASGVVCTGGSSKIPAVQARLANIFSRPVEEHDAFSGVAAGLAIADYHSHPSPLTPPSERNA